MSGEPGRLVIQEGSESRREPGRLVFLAGPISSGDPQDNVNRAKGLAFDLLDAGFVPVVPHLYMYLGSNEPQTNPRFIPNAVWYRASLELLSRSDWLYRIPGFSPGADEEERQAQILGIPIVWSMVQLEARFNAAMRASGVMG